MSLARYIHTRPVRYAMPPQTPPEHAEAMRNFLALHTRAYDLPHMAHVAGQGGHFQHPLIQQLLQSVLGGHEYGAIGPLLDAHHDQTGSAIHPGLGHYFSGSPNLAVGNLIDVLAALHHGVTGQEIPGSLHQMPSPAEIHRRYATGALRGLRPPTSGYPYLGGIQGGVPLSADIAADIAAAYTHGPREPMRMVPAYDHLAALGRQGGLSHLQSSLVDNGRQRIAQALRQGILPHVNQGLQ